MAQIQPKFDIIDYTIYLVPAFIATVVNLAVFIVIRRSDVLQSSKLLRHDLFLNLALGNLVTFLIFSQAVFLPKLLYHEVTCRFMIYISEVSQSVTQASLVIAALCRYLNSVNPYHYIARILHNASSVLIWITAAALCAPYLATHGIVTDDNTTRCDILPEFSIAWFWTISAALSFVPTVTYSILLHFILKTVPPEDEINDDIGTLRFASRIVRVSFVAALTILAPLQILSTLHHGFVESLYTLATISSMLLALASILDPVCFAMLSPSFRREYRLQTSQPGSDNNTELHASFGSTTAAQF